MADLLDALRDALTRTHVRWLLGILLLGLILRVVWIANVQPDPRDGRFDDSVWYFHTGRLLADGEGYVFPGEAFCQFGNGIQCDERPAAALWAPGYPLALAATFLLPGDDAAAARTLNVVAGLAMIIAVYYLGQRLWDRRAGLLAAAIVAVFPSQIFFSSLVITETLFAALAMVLLALAAAWTFERDVSWPKLVALGVVAGALAMVRPEGAVFASVIVLAWLIARRSWRLVGQHAALLVLGMALLFVPWAVRNAIQLDAAVVGTTGLGQVLVQAHHPAADGSPDFFIVAQLWYEYDDIALPERQVLVNNEGVREALTYAVSHPRRELGLVPDRFAAFYRGDRGAIVWNQVEAGSGERALSESWEGRWGLFSDVFYYAVIGVAVITLPFWLRRMRAWHWLLLGPFLAYSAMWAFVFVGEPRYHAPLLPIFALLAAIGLAALLRPFDRLSSRA
ncbi:MAG: glycosyltransferase family 39 protein [Dehalococcoidia bacterium]|nr:glycosyltransferase family 39 protein [Dehalococcoidia bacterium]